MIFSKYRIIVVPADFRTLFTAKLHLGLHEDCSYPKLYNQTLRRRSAFLGILSTPLLRSLCALYCQASRHDSGRGARSLVHNLFDCPLFRREDGNLAETAGSGLSLTNMARARSAVTTGVLTITRTHAGWRTSRRARRHFVTNHTPISFSVDKKCCCATKVYLTTIRFSLD